MFSDKFDVRRSPGRSRLALALLFCGLLLGAIWALTLIGVAVDLAWAHRFWRTG